MTRSGELSSLPRLSTISYIIVTYPGEPCLNLFPSRCNLVNKSSSRPCRPRLLAVGSLVALVVLVVLVGARFLSWSGNYWQTTRWKPKPPFLRPIFTYDPLTLPTRVKVGRSPFSALMGSSLEMKSHGKETPCRRDSRIDIIVL